MVRSRSRRKRGLLEGLAIERLDSRPRALGGPFHPFAPFGVIRENREYLLPDAGCDEAFHVVMEFLESERIESAAGLGFRRRRPVGSFTVGSIVAGPLDSKVRLHEFARRNLVPHHSATDTQMRTRPMSK